MVDVAYRGRGYDHVIACGDGTLTSVFAPRARTRGSEVLLRLDPAGCIAFPFTGEGEIRYDAEVTAVRADAVSADTTQGVTP